MAFRPQWDDLSTLERTETDWWDAWLCKKCEKNVFFATGLWQKWERNSFCVTIWWTKIKAKQVVCENFAVLGEVLALLCFFVLCSFLVGEVVT